MASPHKGTPEYSDGFNDELEGIARAEETDPAYRDGVEAARTVKALLLDAGFEPQADGRYSKTMTVRDRP